VSPAGVAVRGVIIDALQPQFMFDDAFYQGRAAGRDANGLRLSTAFGGESDRQHISWNAWFIAHRHEFVIRRLLDDDVARDAQHAA